MPRKLLKFLILFDNTSLLYFPGQFLSGRVLLELSEETPALGLQFHVVGEGVVRIQNVRDTTDDREKYIDFKMRLLGNDGNNGEVTLLSPGIHSFPFKLGLPYGLPSTFLGRFGWIQYFCKAALREPTGLIHKNHQVFIVMNPIDLNLEYPALSKPFTAEISHNVGSSVLSCFSPSQGGAGNKNKVHCKVMLDRGGYVPGENVLLSAKVVNQSGLKIKGTRLCLTETIEYFMHKKKTRTERRDLVVIKRGKIRPFTMDELNEKIYIPPLPPTNLSGCHLINISYDVFFIIEPKSNIDKPIKLQIPITLGTYPYRENASASDEIENLWPDPILKPETHYPATLPIFRPWLNEEMPVNGVK